VTALDTSVVVAAFAPWHESHDIARRSVTSDAVIPAHVATETYATLTRMPEPFRMDPTVVASYLDRQWGGRILAPDADLYASLTKSAATARVTGGSTYDALVGLTAHSFGHQLLSLDMRAERTYRSLGIGYTLLRS